VKKVIITLVSILVAVAAVLSFLGRGGEYAAEKLFYRASKTIQQIAANPDVAPPAMLMSVEKDLTRIMEKYSKTITAKAAHLKLAEFYMADKKYDKALKTLDSMISLNKDNPMIVSRSHFLKGLTYEMQKNWDKALKEYTILKNKYGTTPLGIQIPLYIGNYYLKNKMEDQAKSAYGEAASAYEKYRTEHKGSMLGYAASGLLVQAYIGLGDYAKAGEAAKNLIMDYPFTQTFAQQLPYIEALYEKRLNQPEKAIEIYKFVLENTKEPHLKRALKKKIDELTKTK